jgi:hypothetical protein
MARDRFEERWRRHEEGGVRMPRSSRPRAAKSRAAEPRRTIALAAQRFGLHVDSPTALFGRISGLEVSVRWSLAEESAWHAVIRAPALPVDLALGKETALTVLKKSIAGEDVLTFDSAFDGKLSVSGDPFAAVGVLDHRTRKRILDLLRLGFLVRDRKVELTFTSKRRSAPSEQIALELRAAVALVKRMSLDRRSAAERLIESVKHDPNPAVCLRCFALLAEEAKSRLERARIPREHVLRAVARALDRSRAPASALAEKALIEVALRVLAEVNAEPHEFDRFGEAKLIRLFEGARGETRTAIVEALGRVGKRAALDALLPSANAVFARGVFKQTVRRAIAAIEARSGADLGRLSIAPVGDRGGLAIARESGGGLGFAKDEGALAIAEGSAPHPKRPGRSR